MKALRMAACVVVGAVLGDVLAATFHWFEDNYLPACSSWPGLSAIAKDNEMHHFFPRTITEYPFARNVAYSSALAGLAVAVYRLSGLGWDAVVLPMLATAAMANGFHKWSHLRDCEVNALLRFLRNRGILCGHEYHAAHHADSSTRYNTVFPATEFLSNPLHRFFEAAILGTFGVAPERISSHTDRADMWSSYQWTSHYSPCPSPVPQGEARVAAGKLFGACPGWRATAGGVA